MERRIRAMVIDLLDVVDASRPFDLVTALTFPLPATMIFRFMGVPEKDWATLEDGLAIAPAGDDFTSALLVIHEENLELLTRERLPRSCSH